MGDLDINLIKEFAKRPAFYDRSNLLFKDKQWNQQAWREISQRLGYDVHLLKDRMLQLRNRYNLEKRRLENLRLEHPNKPVRSPWPLFQHLKFLDGHIRPRRSYKSMMSRRTFEETFKEFENSSMKASDREDYDGDDKPVEIKYETEAESEEDRQTSNNDEHCENLADEDDGNDNSNSLNNFSTTLLPSTMSRTASGASIVPGSISIRNIEAMRREFNTHNPDDSHMNPPKRRKISRYEKFDAFGKFLTISLCDLPEHRALMLIEKFTTDVVKASLETHFGNPFLSEGNPKKFQNHETPTVANGPSPPVMPFAAVPPAASQNAAAPQVAVAPQVAAAPKVAAAPQVVAVPPVAAVHPVGTDESLKN